MLVTAFNPDTNNLEKTYVSTYTAKGATTLPVKNNDRFTFPRRVLIGRMQDERAEIANISAAASDKASITTSATVFDHNADDPVYLLQFDQIRFYRADSATGTYILQNTQDIDVDNADGETKWDDTTALPTHFYKTSFYNSSSSTESPLSDAVQATGYQDKMAGKIVDIVARRVRDTGFTVFGPEEYLDVMDEVGSDLITQAHRPYRFLRRRVTLDTVAGQNWIPFPDNFWKYDDAAPALILGSNKRYIETNPMTLEDFLDHYDQTDVLVQDGIQRIAIDEENSRLLVYPTPKTTQTAVVRLRYYKTFDAITSMSSIIETPNNLIYRYKMQGEYYSAKAETDSQWLSLAKKYEDKYGNEIMKMQRVNRLDTGTQRSLVSSRYRRRRRYFL